MKAPGLRKGLFAAALAAILAAGTAAGTAGPARSGEAVGRWMAGDFHIHTLLTDGSRTPDEVALHAFAFGLDWIAFSEHGGSYGRDQDGKPFPERIPRWITLKYFSFPIVRRLRDHYPEKRILLGVEWNVPSHEHASVGIVSDDPAAVSDFEYVCDGAARDASRALPKRNRTHADAVSCVEMLSAGHGGASYFLPNHPSRGGKYMAADLREFNDAAPGVAFGFEGIPGHQKSPSRGGYFFPVEGARYFRLRGTNLPPSSPGETDAGGNPLSDDMACGEGQVPPRCNAQEKAYSDLWFYSNPIFVEVLTRGGLLR